MIKEFKESGTFLKEKPRLVERNWTSSAIHYYFWCILISIGFFKFGFLTKHNTMLWLIFNLFVLYETYVGYHGIFPFNLDNQRNKSNHSNVNESDKKRE